MKKIEWSEIWTRLRDRFPEWKPTKVEREDWLLGLRVYSTQQIEEAGRHISRKYSSTIPQLAWYIRHCEKQKKEQRIQNAPEPPNPWTLDAGEHERQKEAAIKRLEETPIDDLRTACVSVLKKHGHLITKPESGNVRDWKQTLRGLVYCELFGDRSD